MKRLFQLCLMLIFSLSGALWHVEAQTPPDELIAVDVSPDGMMVAVAGYHGLLQIWDAQLETMLLDLQPQPLPQYAYDAIAWSPDSRQLAAGSSEGVIRILNVSDTQPGQLITTLTGSLGPVMAIDWHPDGSKLVAVSHAGEASVAVWDISDAQLSGQRRAGDLNAVEWQPGTDMITTANLNGSISRLPLPLPSDSMSGYIFGTGAPVRDMEWNTEGTQLAIGYNYEGTIQIVDEDGHEINRLSTGNERIFSLSWSPDGTRIASMGDDNAIQVWKLEDNTLLCSQSLHRETYLSAFDWSPDSQFIYYATTGEALQRMQVPSSHVSENTEELPPVCQAVDNTTAVAQR